MFIGSIEGNIAPGYNDNVDYKQYYLKLMTKNFVISKCIMESVYQNWGVQYDVIPLGIDIKHNPRETNSVDRVIWIGSFIERKRPFDYLCLAEHFPNVSFVMVGSGPLLEKVNEYIKQHKMQNLLLLGRLDNEKVFDEISKSDLLVMTSENEGLPKVIQEAASCGVPTIYINKNYYVDFIENNISGIGVPTIESMIDSFAKLKNNTIAFQKMCIEARRSIENYQWNKLISKYESFFANGIEK